MPKDEAAAIEGLMPGHVIKLDRGYPLVRLSDGEVLRCEHATSLVKENELRAVIGDEVEVFVPAEHDKAIIEEICPRRTELVRKDPTERALPQVMAANFDRIIVAQPLSEVNIHRLERELVLAFETGAYVTVVLTKADLAEDEAQVAEVRDRVHSIVGDEVDTLVVSSESPESVEAVRRLITPGTMAVLMGRSGVGKSSLVNLLVGHEVQQTGEVRQTDGKGRHTTVSREVIDLPGGGSVVDMPGIRGLGLWDARSGVDAAFADIAEAAKGCRFRDCRHEAEPGCAVRAAVEAGKISAERLNSYKSLMREIEDNNERREQARWMESEKAPKGKRGHAASIRQRPGKGRKNR
ncbi:MAG: ribosome small subunit-dependent GTPase A [Eggerthellaceae bacterium]|nr:ribosome small subunit-dependent GTPase A [Eggerthellaceae bacterium]